MSSDLIFRFRLGHRAIKMTISHIQLVVRAYSQAKLRLRELSEELMALWGRQNEEFWEQLNSFYKDNREATKMLEFLIHNLKDLKVKYLIFFDIYNDEWGHVGSKNFSKDFMNFAEEILVRIKLEEEYLFPLLEKLPPK